MNKAYCADCVSFMQTMDAESVDLTVSAKTESGEIKDPLTILRELAEKMPR